MSVKQTKRVIKTLYYTRIKNRDLCNFIILNCVLNNYNKKKCCSNKILHIIVFDVEMNVGFYLRLDYRGHIHIGQSHFLCECVLIFNHKNLRFIIFFIKILATEQFWETIFWIFQIVSAIASWVTTMTLILIYSVTLLWMRMDGKLLQCAWFITSHSNRIEIFLLWRAFFHQLLHFLFILH